MGTVFGLNIAQAAGVSWSLVSSARLPAYRDDVQTSSVPSS